MKLILTQHSSYPRVGDSAELQVLRRMIAGMDRGEKSGADVHAAEDRMTDLALADQVAAGLDILTDGQIRWYDAVSHLAGKLGGVRINGLLRVFDTNTYFRQPVVTGRIERTGPLVVDDFTFASKKAPRPVKAVLTGPLTLARLSIEEDGKAGGFEKLLEGYTAALTAEVAALAKAGATMIQIDEPLLLKDHGDFAQVEKSLSALAAARGKSELILALYFGDARSMYDQLQRLPVQVLCLDFTYSPGLADSISERGSSKALALGLVDGRNTKLEDPKAAAQQISDITRRLSGDRTYLTTSCGLEYLPRDRAQLKLKHLSTIKKEFTGKAA